MEFLSSRTAPQDSSQRHVLGSFPHSYEDLSRHSWGWLPRLPALSVMATRGPRGPCPEACVSSELFWLPRTTSLVPGLTFPPGLALSSNIMPSLKD